MIIDFVHDLVCPWSRIGYANLRTAIAEHPEYDVEIRFRPYQLNADVPMAGVPYAVYLLSIANATNTDGAAIEARINAAAEKAGITFNFDKVKTMPNSLLAHTLTAAAGEADRAKVIEALHKAYWEDGRDIGDADTLVEIAGECGLDPVAMRVAIDFPDLRNRVKELAARMHTDGVNQVPFYVFNDTLSMAGAYQPIQIGAAMAKATELVAAQPAAGTDA